MDSTKNSAPTPTIDPFSAPTRLGADRPSVATTVVRSRATTRKPLVPPGHNTSLSGSGASICSYIRPTPRQMLSRAVCASRAPGTSCVDSWGPRIATPTPPPCCTGVGVDGTCERACARSNARWVKAISLDSGVIAGEGISTTASSATRNTKRMRPPDRAGSAGVCVKTRQPA